MKSAARLCLVLVSASLLTAPVLASEAEPRLQKVGTKDDVSLIFARIGKCILESHSDKARKWLLLIPGSHFETEYVMTQEGALTVCMEHGDSRVVTRGRLTYVASEIRPYIAAAAARSVAYKAPAALPIDPDASPWFNAPLRKLDVLAPRDKIALIQQEFGHCVMKANWAASRDLIRSSPNSRQEDAAIAALIPALGPCVPAGTTVQLTKASVRNALNEPFYHAVTDEKQEAAK